MVIGNVFELIFCVFVIQYIMTQVNVKVNFLCHHTMMNMQVVSSDFL